MTLAELVALAPAVGKPGSCTACAALVCPGWESVPGGFDRDKLQCVGSLLDVANDDPTVAEYHPNGTHSWSPLAPIALGYFPYNRCDVWQCVSCHRAFLRYTEYGGYYSDERIRELHVGLLVDVAPGQ